MPAWGSPNLQPDDIWRLVIFIRNLRPLTATESEMQQETISSIYWYLPESPLTGDDRFNMMNLMYGKIGLVGLRDGVFSKHYPGADAFERMTKTLNDLQHVKQIAVPEQPAIYLFEVDRAKRGLAYVVWERRDTFSGEDSPQT